MKMKKLKRFLISKLNGFDIKNPPKIKKWEISTDDKICVLAPHADDEVIGCGGLLAKYGKQCDVILLTDGAFGGNENIQKTREDEFSKVMNFLKIENFSFMRAKDTRLIEAYDLFKKLDFSKYDYVVMPHTLDPHKDHVVVQAFFKKLKKKKGLKAKTVYYEVWGAMSEPTNFVDISDVAETKRKAIEMYVSQNNIDYAGRILGLNHYRGMRHNVDFAEAYTIAD